MLTRCWYGARLFLAVWVLVLIKINHLNVTLVFCQIAYDEAMPLQLTEQFFNVAIIAGEHVDLNLFWPILKAACFIRHAPQPDKQ